MGDQLVVSRSVKGVRLLVPLERAWRRDVFPFVFLYVAAFGAYLFGDWGDVPLYLFPVFGICHALAVLSCHWSVAVRATLTFRAVSAVIHVQITPIASKGAAAIVDLCTTTSPTGEQLLYFTWRKRKFLWNGTQFVKTAFPVTHTFDEYNAAIGYRNQAALDNAEHNWGSNEFSIPSPEFMELYKEQALAPFFVFQVFCVLLWCLDEYWYYAVFTLFMLLVFEATIVQSRLRNLTSLRSMVQPPYEMNVLRMGQWVTMSTAKLVPGDIVSVVRPKSDATLLPCDILLMRGTCVVNEAMLTGESTPQLKEPISGRREGALELNNDRLHLLFGGTKVIDCQGAPLAGQPKTPDGGCIGYVLRTGFETNQGKLIRTILYSTDRVTANNIESFVFILILLVFAIAASGYVLVEGWDDPKKSTYKLLLECTLIITSVVPPELPMELSLAVNTSLVALSKLGVYCTEPFRIPFAGKTNVCCFDKTGTLTTDKLVLRGVGGLQGEGHASPFELSPVSNLPDRFHVAVAGCHSLSLMDKEVIGDPLEIVALEELQWTVSKGDKCTRKGGRHSVSVRARNHFASALKRMSTVVQAEGLAEGAKEAAGGSVRSKYLICCKGAPETIAERLAEVPEWYLRCYKSFSRQGFRVIAVASRVLPPSTTMSHVGRMSREEVESELEFNGFLVFECPIKSDSALAINGLSESSHMTVMITGDNILTAASVAATLKMGRQLPQLILESDDGEWKWVAVDEQESFAVDDKSTVGSRDFCVSGDGFVELRRRGLLGTFLEHISVFARVSPEQKEEVVVALKDAGNIVLMCGDGTNDVGALKQAHVGVALLNNAPKENEKEGGPGGSSGAMTKSGRDSKSGGQVTTATATTTANSRRRGGKRGEKTKEKDSGSRATAAAAQRQRVRKKPTIGPPSIVDDEELKLVQLGDASIASPFTAKGQSVVPILHIIRQGRCTLVTTLQMFMILALNCLISAYSMSVLYLEGFKMGDTQATIVGLLIAFCFLFISKAKPLSRLSKARPSNSIFTAQFMLSLFGQFAIHMFCLMRVHAFAKELSPVVEEVDVDAPFAPSLINSAVFLISSCMQVSTFAVNYRGRPFMESLWENKPLRMCLCAVGAVTVLAALQVSPAFTEMLELVEFAPEVRNTIVAYMVVDFSAAYMWDRTITTILGRW
eukprot:CAMPEP_0114609380 /NCGR_PEP_ID=MMETSP0168-20121206/3060_1 /TAXON_ID=95228 ORGANISM="Vannella sp., Strain DIVA3 517/6/12" /NCGR_SAMPLE_ID=MMETSP0168 /ASSEMBLY_ACC=CAM_ASM_000044 /LENGTH=1171 /DNA_ID=CAMNT_0001820299 /DNA_START=63 /DNA_END=3576 /DNA_ORIENTATION=-